MKAIPLQLEDLDEVWVQRLDKSSLMASVPFVQAWEKVRGRSVYWAIEDSGEIIAVLPGVEFWSSPLAYFQAMPDGLYANFVCLNNSPALRCEVASAFLSAAVPSRYVLAFLTDYFGEFGNHERCKVLDCMTQVLPISPDWEPPDAKLRSEIRKAEREGVAVQWFSSRRHMSSFLKLMRETERRHGRSPRYPDSFFIELADVAARDERVKWLYVEHDGQPVVSQIYFLERGSLLNWQIYFDKEFSFLKANQFALYSMAKECARTGIRELNFGMTPPDAEGVKFFKEKWGGEIYRYRQLRISSAIGRLMLVIR